MFSRIITGVRNTLNTPTISRPSQQQSRLSIEDSSEEFVRASARPINIIPSTTSSCSSGVAAIFGLSNNNADDFIQKDLISTSLY